MKSLAPNTLIQNRYLVVQLIGKGGMGEVYLAVDQRLGSAVALKRTFFADDEMLGNAFEREARILARLRHPVLPKVSDHFAENGEQYLVMEHISGDDLSKRLEAAQKPFPSSWVLFWSDQLLDALSYLHSHEPPIIHRDIKPQNLKLTDENHIVLLDFGLSKSSTGNTNITSGGSSGSVVGYTPHYAPMEQIRGTGTDPRSDLYSLSATLYQLMTNTVPSDALTRADALLNGMADPIQKINEISPEISSEVSDVILKGMEVSQDKRFGSAREMQKALRKAYTTMHDAMSAHTVAFKAQEALPGGSSASSGSGGSIGESAAVSSYGSESSTPPSDGTSGNPPAENSGGFPANAGGSSGDLDATVNYHGEIEQQVRQADVKTEVYRAGESPLISSGYETPPPAETSYTSNPTPPVENFRPTENIPAGQGFSPDATVPIISLEGADSGFQGGGQASTPEFFTTPNASDSYATATQGGSAQQVAETSPGTTPNVQAARAIPTPAKKKSSSKLILALGALAVLFVLGVVSLGAGYYVYTTYYAGTTEPSPQPSLDVSPSPEPTFESVSDSNSVDNSNSNTNTNANDLTVSPTPFPTSTPEPLNTPGPARPTPQVQIKETPVRPVRTPGPRPTPRPNPTKPPILQ